MDFKQILITVLKTPAFYTALLAFTHAVIFAVWPAFPKEIIVAGDGLILVVAGVVTGVQAWQEQQQRRAIANERSITADGERGGG